MSPAYRAGVREALLKLGFIHLADPEDLPSIARPTKYRQLGALYNMNMMTGMPAGGRIEIPIAYEEP